MPPDLGPLPTSTPIGPVEIQILLALIAIYRQGPTVTVPGVQQVDPVQLATVERTLKAMRHEVQA
jgi:hypothetical protein